MKKSIRQMLAITAMAMAIPMVSNAATSDDSNPERAQAHQRHERHDRQPPGMRMLNELNLTDAQKAQVKQIMEGQKASMKAAWKDRREMQKKLNALADSPDFDKAAADKLIGQMQSKERGVRLQMLETRHQIYMVLTPEQRAQMATMRAKHEKDHARGPEGHQPPPPPPPVGQ